MQALWKLNRRPFDQLRGKVKCMEHVFRSQSVVDKAAVDKAAVEA